MLPGYPAGVAATSPPYPTPRGAIPWGHPLDDHFRKAHVAMVGEVRRASRAGGTTGVGVVPLIHYPLAGGRKFEDNLGRMCGT